MTISYLTAREIANAETRRRLTDAIAEARAAIADAQTAVAEARASHARARGAVAEAQTAQAVAHANYVRAKDALASFNANPDTRPTVHPGALL